MKSYLLLRNNQQSGPYSLKALKKLPIYSSDLFWIENESTNWSFSSEIPELKHLNLISQSINTSISTKDLHQNVKSESYTDPTPLYENEARELFADKSLKRNRSIHLGTFIGSMVTFLLVIVGVLVSAFAVRTIINAFQKNNPLATAQATEIHSLISQSENSAFAEPLIVQATNSANKQILPGDSIYKDRVYTVSKKTLDNYSSIPQKKSIHEALLSDDEKGAGMVSTDPVAIKEMKESDTAETNSSEISKKEMDVRSMIKATANEYKVGVLGGISDLIISVTNNSLYTIEKAIVEINYLKPNGNNIKTEIRTVKNIGSGLTKSIEMPPSSRGVKVTYRIIEASGRL